MIYPKANWPTVMNIAKSLLAVETFYIQTCALMKSLLLPLPFVDPVPEFQEKNKPKYIFHTILEFVCSRVNQIIENDSLSSLSLEAISELLIYFKDKQIKENKENIRLMNKSIKQELLNKVAEIEFKIANMGEIHAENLKKNLYYTNKKRNAGRSYDLGPVKARKFVVEEPQTEYCLTDLSKTEDLYDKEYSISKEEIKSQCLPLSSIPPNLLAKCKNEPPSTCLFLFNLPKKIQEAEILKLLSYFFPSKEQ